MSFTSPVFGEYGNTIKGQDYNMFWTKSHAQVLFTGYGDTTSDFYLKRPFTANAQGLYLPPETFGSIFIRGLLYDEDNTVGAPLFDAATGNIFGNDGGTTTCTTTTATGITDIVVTVAANDTVDALEVLVAETSGGHNVYVELMLELFWVNDTYKSLLGSLRYPAGAASALTAAE